MALFLTIREGPTATESKPIFASADPELVVIVAKAIADRLGNPGWAATAARAANRALLRKCYE